MKQQDNKATQPISHARKDREDTSLNAIHDMHAGDVKSNTSIAIPMSFKIILVKVCLLL